MCRNTCWILVYNPLNIISLYENNDGASSSTIEKWRFFTKFKLMNRIFFLV